MSAHGALEADFPPGAMVSFERYGQFAERGLVVRANDHYVFVRFERGRPSNAVAPDLLTIVADPIPDPRIQMIEDLVDEWKQIAAADDAPLIRVSEVADAITDCLVGAVDQSSEEDS